jgi:hypothetical protein
MKWSAAQALAWISRQEPLDLVFELFTQILARVCHRVRSVDDRCIQAFSVDAAATPGLRDGTDRIRLSGSPEDALDPG